MKKIIPVNKPLFISDEKKFLAKCIDSGWISSEGPFVKEFEEKFSSFVGKKYGVAVSSGTAALEIALGAIGIKSGDEIILPTFTIISCLNAILTYGGKPVFVDSEPATWNIDADKIEEKITKKTKAIMVVHIYGHPCDMGKIMKIAKRHKLLVIEDAAEVHGAEYNGKKCGSFGDISCFSFYANKIINTGEGGMVLTDKKEYKEKAELLRNLGFIKDKRFYHEVLARNYRMTNLQAAVGLAQLKNIKKLIKIKRENAARYTKELKNIPGIILPVEKKYAKNVYWMYGIVLKEFTKFNARKLAERLAKEGIITRPFFYPLHLQPLLGQYSIKPNGKYPVAEKIASQGLYLPSGLGLKIEEIKEVCRIIRKILSN